MNYYNEIDPKAVAWLEVLIQEGLIPNGKVDTRSIRVVQPADLDGFTQCHFFAGIGGWSLALRLAGWPEDRPVWTGSCPCQPFSCAGKGLGEADERHLWPDFCRLISARKPAITFGEQVASKAGREWLSGVRADMEGMGSAFGGSDLCAAGVKAPHIRQRLYWVAHTPNAGSSSEWKAQEWKSGSDTTLRGSQTGRMAHADREQADSAEPGQRLFGTGLQLGRVANSNGWKSSNGELQRSGEHLQWDKDDPTLRMANTAQHRDCQRDGESEQGRERESEIGGRCLPSFWSSAIWHLCQDGKSRRIPPEPAFFPLAPRLPGRVAMLKGFGNAICAPLAAEFIKASDEAMNTLIK